LNGYAAGAASMGNAAVDVKMPGNIRDEIVTVAVNVQALDKVIAAAASAGKLPSDFLAGWAAFKAEWAAFSSSHRMWLQNMWYASYEKTVEYRKRLEDWRKRFEQLTGSTVSYPSPGSTPEGLTGDGKGFPWRTLMWGGLVIGGLYGIAKVFGETRRLKRELIGEHHAMELAGQHHDHGGPVG
jgi:hypothetical protein